jgi:hypothetical protein
MLQQGIGAINPADAIKITHSPRRVTVIAR